MTSSLAPKLHPPASRAEASDAARELDRLDAAFRKATKGGFMDLHFHHYCQRCDQDPAVNLGDLKVGTARRLVTALQFGA